MRLPPLDPEAVPDPIEGSLELSRAVREGLPLLLGTFLLCGLFIGGWLVLLAGGAFDRALEFVQGGDGSALAGLFLVSLPLWLAVLALGVLLRGAMFFRSFGAGHLALDRAAEAEPEEGGAGVRGTGGGMARGILAGSRSPFGALLSLTRGPSALAGEMATALGLMACLFSFLLALLVADAVLLSRGGTLLWSTPPEGGASADAVLLLLGLGAVAAIALSSPLLRWSELRLRALERLERSGPAAVPPGRTPLERFLRRLNSDPLYRAPLEEAFRAGRLEVELPGASGSAYRFDLYLHLPPGGAFGAPRDLFLRVLERPPGPEHLDGMERAVADVCARTAVLPGRIVLLWSPGPSAGFEERPADEVYERLMGSHPAFRAGGRSARCAIELVAEQPDGMYDLVPFKEAGA